MLKQQKLKILICSEAHFLNTGFSNYTKELLQRLHKSDKYEIAEFASYAFASDPRRKGIPWRFYANAVAKNDPRYEEYNSNNENQFGKWRFEKVLLDFRPDVVIDVRDYWMNYYQSISPFRDFFHWIVMPTVDSSPQQESWIETYASADAVMTYSDWGAEVLRNQSNNKIKHIDTVSPGINLDIFKKLDQESRDKLREQFNLKDDFIIGSVMRNQKRKLFPELMTTFNMLLSRLDEENHPAKDKCYLWLHTSYPDAGWDFPLLLKELNIFDKVLFTYFCQNCKHFRPTKWAGPKTNCPRCNHNDFSMPSVVNGPTSNQLSEIYNCMDVYVQYSICEGFGMPQIEASACGNPIITVDYSAMVDIIKKLDAIPIKVKQQFRELETKAMRVYPDNDECMERLYELLSLDKHNMEQLREKFRKLTEQHYNWDNIYKMWESYLDQLNPLTCTKRKWNESPNYLEQIPKNILESNIEPEQNLNAVTNACVKYLKKIEHLCNMTTLDMLCYADYGFVQNGTNIEKYSVNNILKSIQTKIINNNNAEMARSSNAKIQEDFILEAGVS
jgi:glycosyltransferase involved in cell wall biosynthesis